MQGQDWEPVVLRKGGQDRGPGQSASLGGKGQSLGFGQGPGQGNSLGRRPTGPSHAQKLDENTENYKDHRRVPKLLADAIRQRRIDLKLTQDQLAKKVNVRAGVVNDIESQRGVYDAPTIEKIKRVLGITNKSIGLV